MNEEQLPEDWLETLQAEARRCLQEVVTSGKAKLQDGSVANAGEPGFSDLLRTWQWLVNLKPPKKTKVPLPEDFVPAHTHKEKSSGA